MRDQVTWFEQCQQYQIRLFVGKLNWDNWDSYENSSDTDCIETNFIKLTNKYSFKNLSFSEICKEEGLAVNKFIEQGLSLRARKIEQFGVEE